jgi:hypothetical protein
MVVCCSLFLPMSLLIQFTESTSTLSAAPLYQCETIHTLRNAGHLATDANFGGLPDPRDIISRLICRFLPSVHRQLTRTMTIPRTTTITTIRGNVERARAVRYISFDAVVSHNSVFRSLSDEQLEELGGVEFRALNALLWIVGLVSLDAFPGIYQTHSTLFIVSHLCAAAWLCNHCSLYVIE